VTKAGGTHSRRPHRFDPGPGPPMGRMGCKAHGVRCPLPPCRTTRALECGTREAGRGRRGRCHAGAASAHRTRGPRPDGVPPDGCGLPSARGRPRRLRKWPRTRRSHTWRSAEGITAVQLAAARRAREAPRRRIPDDTASARSTRWDSGPRTALGHVRATPSSRSAPSGRRVQTYRTDSSLSERTSRNGEWHFSISGLSFIP
jgi:hypothetical protein